MEIGRILRDLMVEAREDEIVQELLNDEDMCAEFIRMMEGNAAEFLEDNFNILFSLTLFQYGIETEDQEEDVEEITKAKNEMKDYSEDEENSDIAEMAQVLEE